MSDSDANPVLNRRKWPLVRKLQIAFGLAGVSLTAVLFVPLPTLGRWFETQQGADLALKVILVIAFPAAKLCQALGIAQGPAWCWVAIVVNGLLCVLLGTVVGRIISRTRKLPRPQAL
jgi:hypothetical protein